MSVAIQTIVLMDNVETLRVEPSVLVTLDTSAKQTPIAEVRCMFLFHLFHMLI